MRLGIERRVLDSPHELLPRYVFLGLLDKSFEQKRKAALLFGRFINNLVAREDYDKIDRIVCFLLQHFVSSSKTTCKIGGLLGLAAVAIALGPPHIHLQEERLLGGAFIGVFTQSMSIKLYSCECLYNIAKVSRTRILEYSPLIFDVLSRLCSDPFPQVSAASKMLNGLMSDIFLEQYISDISRDIEENSIAKTFTDLVSQHSTAAVPGTRIFLIEWLRLLSSLPNFCVLEFLPDFLEHLIGFLNDTDDEVRTATNSLLDDFIEDLVKIRLDPRYSCVASLSQSRQESSRRDQYPKEVFGDRLDMIFTSILKILTHSLGHYDGVSRAMCLKWIGRIMPVINESTLTSASIILEILLKNVSHKSQDIRSAAYTALNSLYAIVENSPPSPHMQEDSPKAHTCYIVGNVKSICDCLQTQCYLEDCESNAEIIKWYTMLLKKLEDKDNGGGLSLVITSSLKSSLHCLFSSNDLVFDAALHLLCEILKISTGERLNYIVNYVIEKMCTDGNVLGSRSYAIVVRICTSIDQKLFYEIAARRLSMCEDKKSIKSLIFTLYHVLLAAPELRNLRDCITRLDSKESLDLFLTLYDCWCYSFIPLISLCFLAAAYEHAFDLITLYSTEITDAEALSEIEEFVLLFESPAFSYLRFRLARSDASPYLLKSICGLLVLIPQSNAYKLLSNRLALGILQHQTAVPISSDVNSNSGADGRGESSDLRSCVPWDELLSKYKSAMLSISS